MKKILILSVLSTVMCGMDQPLSVVKLEEYTLVSNEGKEISISGNLVRALAPGLAHQFRQGFKEGQTGKITIPHLDQESLQALKKLLEVVYPFQQAYAKQIEEIDRTRSNALTHIAALPQNVYQQHERNKILEEIQAQKDKIFLPTAQQIRSALEKLPNVGDHFLELFNNLIYYDVTPVLGKALALFAAEHIDFADDVQYEELKKLDPQAQLLYLFHATYTPENISRALEWFKQLVSNPNVVSQQKNIPFVTMLSDAMADFIGQNIAAILKKHPNFRAIIQDPVLVPLKARLESNLKHDSKIAFETVIFSFDKHEYPDLYDLGNNRLAIVHNKTLHIYDTNNYNRVKQLPLSIFDFKNTGEYQVARGFSSEQIIVFRLNRIFIYDFNTNTIVFDYTFKQRIMIVGIYVLDESRLAVMSQSPESKSLRILDTKNVDKEPQLIKDFGKINQIFVMDDRNAIIHSSYETADRRNAPEILLVDFNSLQLKHNWRLNSSANNFSLQKISSSELVAKEYNNDKEAEFSLIQINPIQLKRLGSWKPRIGLSWEYRFFILNADYFIASSGNSSGQIWSLTSNLFADFIPPNFVDLRVIKQNLIRFMLPKLDHVILKFVPQTSSLLEIFDEIEKHTALQEKKLKRPAEQPAQQPFVPAAAKGLRPEERKAKRPREEKEKPNG